MDFRSELNRKCYLHVISGEAEEIHKKLSAYMGFCMIYNAAQIT
jgi:hypothetical protein